MHLACETMAVTPALIDTKTDVAALRERYLGSRGRILRQFVNYSSRKGKQNIITLDIVSANGDVKADILYTRCYGDGPTHPLYKDALRKIYGIEEWDGIFDEWSATSTMRPVPIPNQFPFGAQSFSDLKQEARRTYQATHQNPSAFPSRLLESDDMVAILNARGTVLLNLAFRNHVAQLPVIKLASLAVCLWGELGIQPSTDTTASEALHEKFYQQNSAHNDVIQRAITMIRDDIHAHLLNATSSLEPSYMNSQQRHIKVLRETIATWQNMTNKRITPDWEDMADAIRDLCEKCNNVLAYDSQAHRESLGWPGNLSVQTRLIEDHGSEWMGMLLRDENCRLVAREVEIQFLRRENSGFWFRA